MDHELVSFINEYCDKSRTTSQEFTYDKIDVVDLSVFPLLSELSREKLDHRIKLLKYFNQVMAQMLPLIDIRNLNEERSLAFPICHLLGLMFYDVKVGYLSDVLAVTRSYVRRPMIS